MKINKTFAKLMIFIMVFSMCVTVSPAGAASRFTSISDTMTDLSAGDVANHTIAFTLSAAGALDESDTLTVTFPAGWNIDLGANDYMSIDLKDDSTDLDLYSSADAGKIGVGISGQIITFTLGSGVTIDNSSVMEIQIGTNATYGDVGTNQITSSSTPGFHQISITTKADGSTTVDTGTLGVYLIADGTGYEGNEVTLTATVDPTLSFSIEGGMDSGEEPHAIDFGTLEPNAYHQLMGETSAYAGITVSTNPAAEDYVEVHSLKYYFKATAAEADAGAEYVLIGAATADTAENLYRAINNNDGTSVRANVDPGASTTVWVVATTAGTTGNTYTIVDGTGGDVALTQDSTPGTFVDGAAGSNYKNETLTYGATDGVDMENEATGTNLQVSTNGAGGYVVTVKDTGAGRLCTVAGCASGYNIPAWVGQYGFGMWASAQSSRYGAAAAASNEIVADGFDVDTSDTPHQLSTTASTLASYSGPIANDNIAVEYVVRIDAEQTAGEYQDVLTFIATGTF